MSKVVNVFIRCLVCINLYVSQSEVANEARRIDDAEFVAFEAVIDSVTFLAVRS